MIDRRVAALLLVLLLSFTGDRPSSAAAKNATEKAAHPKRRILEFPKGHSIGLLRIFAKGQEPEDGKIISDRAPIVVKPAIGHVEIGAGQFVQFKPNGNFYKHPDLLDQIPPDGLDKIDLQFIPMFDEDIGRASAAMKYVTRLKGLKSLNVDKSDLKDDSFCQVEQLPNLTCVSAYATQITGACLKNLAKLKKLRSLTLGSANIKKTDLQYLYQMPNLIYLSLKRCALTDSDLGFLDVMPNLESLSLCSSPELTDACIDRIAKLKKLQYLDLRECPISIAAFKKLKGLHLVAICIPSKKLRQADVDDLQRALPSTALMYPHHPGKANPDVEELFAPVSRH